MNYEFRLPWTIWCRNEKYHQKIYKYDSANDNPVLPESQNVRMASCQWMLELIIFLIAVQVDGGDNKVRHSESL